jgi:hypothetical protein
MNQGVQSFPKLSGLPSSLSEGSISISTSGKGIPAFRASSKVIHRVEILLEKAAESVLSPAEVDELAHYEEIDDYLSHLNRVVRNLQSH